MANPGAATTVTYPALYPIGNVPKLGAFTVALTPASVAAASVAPQSFAATGIGLAVGDVVSVSFQGVQTTNVTVTDAYVSANDTLVIRFTNPTVAAVVPAAGSYAVTVMRPTPIGAVGASVPQLSY